MLGVVDAQVAVLVRGKKSAQKGRPIPENDIWIAALALQHTLVLVSRDAHFREVENLELEVW